MDYNDQIRPLERVRSTDGFVESLNVARSSSLSEPLLSLSSNHGLDFESGIKAAASAGSLVIATERESVTTRALIAILTSLDAGSVLPLTPGCEEKLTQLRELIWLGSQERGDYEALMNQDTEISGLVGALIGAAIQGVVAIIDGVDAYAAALLAQRIAFRSVDRCLAAAPSHDPAIKEAQLRLRLSAVLAAPAPRNSALVALRHLQTTLQLSN